MNRLASKEVATKDTQAVTASDIVILVVDDKPNIIKQISDICARNNWIVRATDEASALSAWLIRIFGHSHQHGSSK